MARLLVESASQQAALDTAKALKARCDELLSTHPVWRKRTLMCMLDQPPVTVLRGKTRWHVMFKLLVHPETESWVA